MSRVLRALTAAGAVLIVASCNGNGSPAGPTAPPPGAGPVGATITIGANGAISPAGVTIDSGQSVAFVNEHDQAHEIASNPHPVHNDCPAINAVGRLSPGQMRNTNALTVVRTCGFHDHLDPDNPALMGSIVVR